MKNLAATAILTLAAIWGTGASAQVYGTNDDPYQQNPFASGMTLPEQPAAQQAAPATAPAAPQQTADKTQQAAVSGASSGDGVTNTAAKKPAP